MAVTMAVLYSAHPVSPTAKTPAGAYTPEDEEAGASEAFVDAALYDFEYRRRRADVRFYRRIAEERRDFGGGGPVLDLACGTGRLTQPLLRDGHTVVGLDHSASMLARAAARVARLSPRRRARALLLRGDLRALPTGPRFGLVLCAFHSVQHLVSDQDLAAFFRGVRRSLVPGGWLAFDLLPPEPGWIARDPTRRWGRTRFRHPVTGQRFVSTNNHVYDPARRALHIRLYYQPVDAQGRPSGPELVHRLCHRQLTPAEVKVHLERARLSLITSFGGFDARPLLNVEGEDDEHIYVARRPHTARRP
jgi:SAM-dependent methyltransferase